VGGIIFGLLLAIALHTGTCPAQETAARVLRIDGVEFYVDLGVQDGLQPGDQVFVYRTLRLTDADGAVLQDHFLMGTAQVLEVGQSLSLVQVDPSVALQLSVGDRVSQAPLPRPRPEAASAPVQASPTPTGDAPDSPAVSADRLAFESAFAQAAGLQSPSERADVWRSFVQAHPSSELSEAARQEIRSLQALERPARSTEATPVDTPQAPELRPTVRARPSALIGQPVPVWVTVPSADRVDTVVLFFRRDTETLYRSVPMEPAGDAAWLGEIPADASHGAHLDYYVAVVDTLGREVQRPAAQTPGRVDLVTELPPDGAVRNRSQVRLSYDYVDFYKLRGVDRYQRFEADFTYRVGLRGLQAVRVGFGSFSGVTRPVARLDDPESELKVGFNLGYVELEVPLGVDWVGVAGRGMIGIGREGLSPGGSLRLRLGREEGTHMGLSGAYFGPLGTRGELSLAWSTVPRVPMQAWVEVTNLPAATPSDWGVGVGWEGRVEVTRWLQLGLRGSYQLRNTEHAGPGLGGTVVFAW
jgi:hypothetical protein